MDMSFDEQGRQLKKPTGALAVQIVEFMNKANKTLYSRVFEQMKLRPGCNVLELGQGNAPIAENILSAHNNILYTGLDYSPDSIALAKLHNAAAVEEGRMNLVEGTVSSMPFGDAQFDLVFGVNVIYFFEDPQTEWKQMYRVLKPGGQLILGYRPKHCLNTLPFTHQGFRHYDIPEVEQFLQNEGFTEIMSTEHSEPDREIRGKMYKMNSAVTVAQKR